MANVEKDPVPRCECLEALMDATEGTVIFDWGFFFRTIMFYLCPPLFLWHIRDSNPHFRGLSARGKWLTKLSFLHLAACWPVLATYVFLVRTSSAQADPINDLAKLSLNMQLLCYLLVATVMALRYSSVYEGGQAEWARMPTDNELPGYIKSMQQINADGSKEFKPFIIARLNLRSRLFAMFNTCVALHYAIEHSYLPNFSNWSDPSGFILWWGVLIAHTEAAQLYLIIFEMTAFLHWQLTALQSFTATTAKAGGPPNTKQELRYWFALRVTLMGCGATVQKNMNIISHVIIFMFFWMSLLLIFPDGFIDLISTRLMQRLIPSMFPVILLLAWEFLAWALKTSAIQASHSNILKHKRLTAMMRGKWPENDVFNAQYDHMVSFLDECDEAPRLLGCRIDNDVYGQVFLAVAVYALSCMFGDLDKVTSSLREAAVETASTVAPQVARESG